MSSRDSGFRECSNGGETCDASSYYESTEASQPKLEAIAAPPTSNSRVPLHISTPIRILE